jgi:hypothetical protein
VARRALGPRKILKQNVPPVLFGLPLVTACLLRGGWTLGLALVGHLVGRRERRVYQQPVAVRHRLAGCAHRNVQFSADALVSRTSICTTPLLQQSPRREHSPMNKLGECHRDQITPLTGEL